MKVYSLGLAAGILKTASAVSNNPGFHDVLCELQNSDNQEEYISNYCEKNHNGVAQCPIFLNLLLDSEYDCDANNEDDNLNGNRPSVRGAFDKTSWSNNIIKAIDGYGCWCYFDMDTYSVNDGLADPVNDMDQFCKILMHGYKCMAVDASDESDTACDPVNTDYISAIGFVFSDGTQSKADAIWTSCQDVNGGDNCEARACAVEGYFIMNVFDYLLSGGSLDTTKKHGARKFRPSTECTVTSSSGGAGQGKVCCGTYPERAMHTMRDDNASRSCCGRHYILAGDSDKQCCDDLTVINPTTRTCCNTGYGMSKLIGMEGNC